jgi:PAS domain S-box-containing protein
VRGKNMAASENIVHPHQEILNGVKEEFKEILEKSKQAIYVYLDDTHRICNQKFASLLGYKSIEEWSAIDEPFTEAFVMHDSQEILVSTYGKAMEDKVGSNIEVSWKKKSGASVKTSVIIVPISYKGELLALHFITKI